AMFFAAVNAMVRVCQKAILWLHNGSLQRYMAFMISGIVIVGYITFFTHEHGEGSRQAIAVTPVAAVGWLLLVGCSLAAVCMHHSRLLALLSVGVVGLIVSVGFLYFSAPDLALTQISVEVVTVILILLALYFMPKQTP